MHGYTATWKTCYAPNYPLQGVSLRKGNQNALQGTAEVMLKRLLLGPWEYLLCAVGTTWDTETCVAFQAFSFCALQVNQKRPELARMNQEPAQDKPDKPTTEE